MSEYNCAHNLLPKKLKALVPPPNPPKAANGFSASSAPLLLSKPKPNPAKGDSGAAVVLKVSKMLVTTPVVGWVVVVSMASKAFVTSAFFSASMVASSFTTTGSGTNVLTAAVTQLLLMNEKYWPSGHVEPAVLVDVVVVVVVVGAVGKVQPALPKFANISAAVPAEVFSKTAATLDTSAK